MWVGICKRLLTVITVAHICVRVVTTTISLSVAMSCSVSYTKETVLGLHRLSCLHTGRTVNKPAAQMNNCIFARSMTCHCCSCS